MQLLRGSLRPESLLALRDKEFNRKHQGSCSEVLTRAISWPGDDSFISWKLGERSLCGATISLFFKLVFILIMENSNMSRSRDWYHDP